MEETWSKLGKEELEHQYSPSHWSHRMDRDAVIEAHVRELTEGTEVSRAAARTALDIPYGDSDSEKMDLYLPDGEPTKFPILVYVHGGYWQFLSKEESGFMAAPLLSHGIAVMVMDYDIAPKGDMDLMVAQVRCSIAAVLRLYPQNTGVYLCGHSAGAHLVAMTLCTDWMEYGVTAGIKGAVLVSGVYDLQPIIHTYVNDALQMSLSQDERRRFIGGFPSVFIALTSQQQESTSLLCLKGTLRLKKHVLLNAVYCPLLSASAVFNGITDNPCPHDDRFMSPMASSAAQLYLCGRWGPEGPGVIARA
ncbi:kynurenine formamidase isoform X1 [Bufo bufo]|uniref:kynurenine formamidase isoform X1 n=1 Tax=Bufo bufo TaxID=8384 RepID=UPI001ABDAF34|nr:kynurenine formamidase isoform X1 [Bufo bufo]